MTRIIITSILVGGLVFLLPFLSWHSWTGRNRKAIRRILRGIFLIYILGVLYFTLFSRDANSSTGVQLKAFYCLRTVFYFDFSFGETLRQIFANGLTGGLPGFHMVRTALLKGMVLNILLYIPFGYMLPEIFPKLRKHYPLYVLLTALAMSVATETIQLVFHLGWFDMDDILDNMIGTLAGIGLYKGLLSRYAKENHHVQKKKPYHSAQKHAGSDVHTQCSF